MRRIVRNDASHQHHPSLPLHVTVTTPCVAPCCLRSTARALALLGTYRAGAAGPRPRRTAPSVRAWDVARAARVTIRGHGFGHGHGMSQYGAEGAAREGLTTKQIAEFYYPGTGWGASEGKVSVLLTADTSDDVVVRSRSGLAVHDSAAKGRTALPENGATQWRITTDQGVTKTSPT